MSHPGDTGNTGVGRALSALRRLRGKAPDSSATSRTTEQDVPTTPRADAEDAAAVTPEPAEIDHAPRADHEDAVESTGDESDAEESDAGESDAEESGAEQSDAATPDVDATDESESDVTVSESVSDQPESDEPAAAHSEMTDAPEPDTTPEVEPEVADAVEEPVDPADAETDHAVPDNEAADDTVVEATPEPTPVPVDADDFDGDLPEVEADEPEVEPEPEPDQPDATEEPAVDAPAAAAETVSIEKPTAATPTAPTEPVADEQWRSDTVAPQYIPPSTTPSTKGNGGGGRSRKTLLWVSSVVVIIVAIAAVVLAVFATRDEPGTPQADRAADTATKYATALRDGDLTTLRAVTCGERKAFYDRVADDAFRQQFETQKANNELIEVREVKASQIVDPTNAVVEVVASSVATPDKTTDVTLRLRNENGDWKVCTAG